LASQQSALISKVDFGIRSSNTHSAGNRHPPIGYYCDLSIRRKRWR
jgi:hypothetical protein